MGNDFPRYGGFWRRVAAALIDGLVFSIVSIFLSTLLYGPAYVQSMLGAEGEVGTLAPGQVFIDWLLPALITVFCWMRFRGTPGKLLMGCLVVDAVSGGSLRPRQAGLRYFGYLVSLLPFGLGFLWIIWDKRKQGFHDKIANTMVILEDESRMPLAELEGKLR
jgi:uncharacterized RDD family membrane protein YckC